jgi:hypothetical protein
MSVGVFVLYSPLRFFGGDGKGGVYFLSPTPNLAL